MKMAILIAMRRYSIAAARNHLPALVHGAERGAVVELTRRGLPVAVLLSERAYRRLAKGRPDFWTALQEFRRTHDLPKQRVDQVFAGVRDRSEGRGAKW